MTAKKTFLLLALALIFGSAVYGTISLTQAATTIAPQNIATPAVKDTTAVAMVAAKTTAAKTTVKKITTAPAKKTTAKKKALAKKTGGVTWTTSGLQAVGSLRSFDYSTTIRNAYMAKIAAYAKARGIKKITAAVVNEAHQ